MKNFICFTFIACLIGVCSICIAQEAINANAGWEPEGNIWVDISGSMKNELDFVGLDLINIVRHGGIQVKSIKGFFNRQSDKSIKTPGFSRLDDLEIANNPGDTLSPVVECVKMGIEELKDYQILLFATDEINEAQSGNIVVSKCIDEFRTALLNDKSCPWVFFMDDINSRYRIYIMIRYNPVKVNVAQQDKIAMQFLGFLDNICGRMGRKSELFWFQPPQNFVVFDINPLNIWETWPSGVEIDSQYGYQIKYTPRAYQIVKGDFTINTNEPLAVSGFSDKSSISDYKAEISRVSMAQENEQNLDPSHHTIQLGNLSRAEPLDIKFRLNFKAPKPNWKDFFSHNKGFVMGNIPGLTSGVVFSPPQDEYPNLIIKEASERIDKDINMKPCKANIGFQYVIRYPTSWWFWRVLLIFALLGILISIIAFTMRPNNMGKIEILADSAYLLTMNLDRETSRMIEAKVGDDLIQLGRIMKGKDLKNLKFAPSDKIGKVNGQEVAVNSKPITMYINNPITLELLTNNEVQDGSYTIKNTINLMFRQVSEQTERIVEKPFYP